LNTSDAGSHNQHRDIDSRAPSLYFPPMPVAVLDQKRRNWTDEELEALPRDGRVYTADSVESLTRAEDVLMGGTALPGFRCKLGEIFRPV
jgi:hypothetical protein